MLFRNSRNKSEKIIASAILIALLALTTFMAGFPVASAHDPAWNIPTYAYITAQPNPIGVNQRGFLVFWLDLPPPTAAGAGGDRWQGFTIEVTSPSGKTETLGPYTSDPTGGTFALFTPDEVGVYTFDLHFPGQTLSLYNPDTGVEGSNSQYIGDFFEASDASCTMTVQDQPIEKIPASPLPTEFWTRPINQINSAWASVASNWLGLFQDYHTQDDGVAPNSAHIMWTMPLEFGGILGGNSNNEVGYYSGMSYEVRFGNALILQGRLYFNTPLGNNAAGGPYTCVDLATGEIVWQKEGISPTFASLYDYESPNQHGVVPSGALYQSVGGRGQPETWIAYDPFTGAWLYNLTDIPSGTQVLQTDGTIARYVLSYSTSTKSGWIAKWTTAALTDGPLVLTPGTTTNAWQYRPIGKNADMSNNYEWNKTITYDLTGSSSPSIVYVLPGDIILGRSSNIATTSISRFGTDDPFTLWAISDKGNSRGNLAWKQEYAAPPNNITQMLPYQQVDKVNRVFTMTYFETGERVGYNLDTGNYMWGPVGTPYQVDHAFQYFSSRAGQHAYGELLVGGYGGEVIAYDTTNGNTAWVFNDTNHGLESNWGMIPTFVSIMADNKVFAIGGEHSPNTPLYKNERLYAIDATTGQEVWNLTGWGSSGLGEAAANMYVADGYLVFYNNYDNQIYCIGKGPSATTVSAPQLAATVGSSVMITGTVTDQSPGAVGKAAVSDAWMTPWMEYLYEQQPLPTNAVGVTVSLKAYDCATGAEYDIGTTSADLNGNFGIAWQPTQAGSYAIVASFDGSNSYWPSSNTAYMVVDSAPNASPVNTPTPTPVVTAPPTGTTASPTPVPTEVPGTGGNTALYVGIAAVVVIAIIVAIALILRRRK